MCLVALALQVHPDYPLVIAANRDEYYARPTDRAGFWQDQPGILGGRDALHGGSWFAVSRDGRFAAVTNIRGDEMEKDAPRSRGLLVSGFLSGTGSMQDYLEQLVEETADYNAFNLLLGTAKEVFFMSSRKRSFQRMEQGIHAVSNGELDEAWPKVIRIRKVLAGLVANGSINEHESLLQALADREQPRDGALPDTGVGEELERLLAPVFIHGDSYGTRASTVFSIDRRGQARFVEKVYDAEGASAGAATFEWQIEDGAR